VPALLDLADPGILNKQKDRCLSNGNQPRLAGGTGSPYYANRHISYKVQYVSDRPDLYWFSGRAVS
jgi:hypothetical protein